jgi:hypothetical protein
MVQVCISTFNQTVNLIPALQHRVEKLFILSSNYAQKTGWTGRLVLLLKRYAINYEIVKETQEGFSRELLLDRLKEHENIEWNISGGKKSQTMILQEIYQKRKGLPGIKDYLIYLENNPFELSIYDDYRLVRKETEKVTLELEDILNLYGYSCAQKTDFMGKEILTYNATGLNNYSFKNNSVAELNAFLLEKESELFRRFFYNYMYKAGWWEIDEADNKSNLFERIKDLVNHYKPEYLLLAQQVEKPVSAGFEKMNSIVNRYLKNGSSAKYYSLAQELKRMNKSEVLYSDYWNQIKTLIVHDLFCRINKDKPSLYIETLDIQEKEALVEKILSSGGGTGESNSFYNMPIGMLFEEMIFSRVKKSCLENGFSVDKCYVNVKTHTLQTDDKGEIMYPGLVREHEYDDELDVVIVKNNGTLLILEAKTFGLSGDVMKSLTDSVFKKSGVFGRSIFVIPLLNFLKDEQGYYPDYVPGALISADATFRKHGVKYYCFDEIASLVEKEIKQAIC